MINNDYKLFEKYLKRDWYIQGFSAVLLFASAAAMSGTFMKKYLNFGYSHFLFNFRDGYGEMAYDPEDLKRIWKIVKIKLGVNPGYLKEIKNLYLSNIQKFKPFFDKIKKDDLTQISDKEIIYLFQELIRAQLEVIGVSHIIDAIGIELEKEFQKTLKNELSSINQFEFNEIFARLITPSKISFVNQEENDLLKIKGGIKNKTALTRHTAKYFYLQNSYAGPKILTVDDFREKLISLKKEKRKNQKKKQFILPCTLSRDLKRMISIIDYCAVWQDERKALLFKNVSYVGFVLSEIAGRLNIDIDNLYYISVSEVKRLKSLSELYKIIKKLEERRNGSLVIIKGLEDKVISGVDYKRLMKNNISLIKNEGKNGRELHGTVANTGTARGRVRIIRNIESLKNFQKGEILIASMTRPEYMSAIKKAAAIVTDEGGITCHAAIIARELNIPTIIGTKIATQTFLDGDLVEVRANHGIVRILE